MAIAELLVRFFQTGEAVQESIAQNPDVLPALLSSPPYPPSPASIKYGFGSLGEKAQRKTRQRAAMIVGIVEQNHPTVLANEFIEQLGLAAQFNFLEFMGAPLPLVDPRLKGQELHTELMPYWQIYQGLASLLKEIYGDQEIQFDGGVLTFCGIIREFSKVPDWVKDAAFPIPQAKRWDGAGSIVSNNRGYFNNFFC